MKTETSWLGVLLFLCITAGAWAQEATNTPAATQPSAGAWYLRQKLQYIHYGSDPGPEDRDINRFIASTSLTYGITRNLSITGDLPVALSFEDQQTSGDEETLFGTEDAAISLKWRPFQWDTSPVDSVRLAFFGGVELPTGTGDLGSHSFDPFAGAVMTAIRGRHGLNQSLQFKLNTGGDDFNSRPGDGPSNAVRSDTAYLFRLSPETYTADVTAATYLTLELNGLYETAGNVEFLFGPGILYEARSFALEASIGVPVYQDVDDRPETNIVITLGFRILF